MAPNKIRHTEQRRNIARLFVELRRAPILQGRVRRGAVQQELACERSEGTLQELMEAAMRGLTEQRQLANDDVPCESEESPVACFPCGTPHLSELLARAEAQGFRAQEVYVKQSQRSVPYEDYAETVTVLSRYVPMSDAELEQELKDLRLELLRETLDDAQAKADLELFLKLKERFER